MDFKSSYRMEAVYFQKLKSDIDIAKSLMNAGNTEEARAMLENAVDVDGAVLLLYRNLGELWGELGAKIEDTKKELEKLDNRVGDNLRELNEKIDDVNNTIIRLIRALEERVKALEDCCEEVREELENKQDKLTPGIGIEIDENNVIDNTILSLFNLRSAIAGLRNKINITIEEVNFSTVQLPVYGIKVNIAITDTAESLRANLDDYKGLEIDYNLSIVGDNLTQILNVGDNFELILKKASSDFSILDLWRINNHIEVRKESGAIGGEKLNNHLVVYGFRNLLKTYNDSDTITLNISLEYLAKVNGAIITDTSAYRNVTNRNIYGNPSGIIPYGLK